MFAFATFSFQRSNNLHIIYFNGYSPQKNLNPDIKMRLLTFFTLALANETYDAVTLFHQIDRNYDQQLTVNEVAQWIERTVALDRKLKTDQIFKAYDDNENGRVDRHEMQFRGCSASVLFI